MKEDQRIEHKNIMHYFLCSFLQEFARQGAAVSGSIFRAPAKILEAQIDDYIREAEDSPVA